MTKSTFPRRSLQCKAPSKQQSRCNLSLPPARRPCKESLLSLPSPILFYCLCLPPLVTVYKALSGRSRQYCLMCVWENVFHHLLENRLLLSVIASDVIGLSIVFNKPCMLTDMFIRSLCSSGFIRLLSLLCRKCRALWEISSVSVNCKEVYKCKLKFMIFEWVPSPKSPIEQTCSDYNQCKL